MFSFATYGSYLSFSFYLRKIQPFKKKLLSITFRSSDSKRRLTDEAISQFLDGLPDGSDVSGDEDDEDLDNMNDVDDGAGLIDEVSLVNKRQAGVDR